MQHPLITTQLYLLIFTLTINHSLPAQETSQAKSAIQFRDTTGAAKTAKIGWTGDAASGHFFIQTPNEGELIKSKTGGVEINGSMQAINFIGDGSRLINLPKDSLTVDKVAGLKDSLANKADGSSLSKKADTTWVKEQLGKLGVMADSATIAVKMGSKADTGWVNVKIGGKVDTAMLASKLSSKADTGWAKTKISDAVSNITIPVNSVDSAKIVNGGISGGDIDPATKVTVGSLTVNGLHPTVKMSGTGEVQARWVNNESLADQKTTELKEIGGCFSARFVNDAYTAADYWLGVYRNEGTYTTKSVIFPSGNVGIGNYNPGGKLEVFGPNALPATTGPEDPNIILRLRSNDIATDYGMAPSGVAWFQNRRWNDCSDNFPLVLQPNGGNVGIGTTTETIATPSEKLEVNGNIKAIGSVLTSNGVCCASDRRLKTSITPLSLSLDKVVSLQGISYQWNRASYPERNFPEGKQIGLIAQDVETIIPEIVSTDAEGYKSLAYDRLVALLIEAVKEQKVIVDKQKIIADKQQEEIDQLHSEIEEIRMVLEGRR